jgi:hypothetical protein
MNVIDVIALDPKTDEVALVMQETRPWDGTDLRIYQLQEKVNTYLSFALDGEMAESYPAFTGKALRLQLDCVTAPDARTLHFLSVVREQIGFQHIKLEVNVVPTLTPVAVAAQTSGGGCGCGSATPCK